MIYTLIGLSLLFVSLGFIITEGNAKYLLSGYNTMSEADRQKVDLQGFLPYFRKFHLFLGISLLVLGVVINHFNKTAMGVFLAVYPIAAYIYFIATSAKYSQALPANRNKIGIIILIITLAFVAILLFNGLKGSELIVNENSLEITGIYGEVIERNEIKSITVHSDLPDIKVKTNGFALGATRKGYFISKEGEKVKLILNTNTGPFILIEKTDGNKVYYSAKSEQIEEMVLDLKRRFNVE